MSENPSLNSCFTIIAFLYVVHIQGTSRSIQIAALPRRLTGGKDDMLRLDSPTQCPAQKFSVWGTKC